jgi:DNA-binding CsgD family transcriptional regulator
VLQIALTSRVGILVYAGELDVAASVIEEVEAAGTAVGSELGPYAALALIAWQGDEAEAAEVIDASMEEMVRRGEGIGLGVIHWARAFLHNCAGRYDEALAAAEQTGDYPATLLYARWGLIELIEAAARSGKTDRAAEALLRLSETTQASGTDWALGIEARSRALVTEGQAAEHLYREARLATGETARRRTAGNREQLTAQEAHIARLARDGLSNPEIGARLFISPRTVEYHLRKVFTKVGISSRKQLREALADGARAALSA